MNSVETYKGMLLKFKENRCKSPAYPIRDFCEEEEDVTRTELWKVISVIQEENFECRIRFPVRAYMTTDPDDLKDHYKYNEVTCPTQMPETLRNLNQLHAGFPCDRCKRQIYLFREYMNIVDNLYPVHTDRSNENLIGSEIHSTANILPVYRTKEDILGLWRINVSQLENVIKGHNAVLEYNTLMEVTKLFPNCKVYGGVNHVLKDRLRNDAFPNPIIRNPA